MVHLQDVLHGVRKRRIRLRRQAPAPLQPRFEDVFLSVRRTVSRLTEPTISHSTSRIREQAQRPPHITRWGLAAGYRHQSSLRLPIQHNFARRFNCSFRSNAASSPSSTQRRRTRATVVAMPTSRASAISQSVRPPFSRPSSHCNRLRACVCFRADTRPFLVRSCNASHSSVVNRTRYLLIVIQNAPCSPVYPKISIVPY